jgi:DNA-binding transcriptional MerR regulator
VNIASARGHYYRRMTTRITTCQDAVPPANNVDGRGQELSISELARTAGVSTRSLRYYEEQGLLAPQRSAAGHRRYDSRAVGCVSVIQCLYAAGVRSHEVRAVVRESHSGDARSRIAAVLHRRRNELQVELNDRFAALERLDQMLTRFGVHTGVNL